MSHETARKIETVLIRGLDNLGQKRASEVLQTTTSTVSKIKNGGDDVAMTFPKLARLLDEMGLKIVPLKYKCYDPESIQEILSMAKKYMQVVDLDTLEF